MYINTKCKQLNYISFFSGFFISYHFFQYKTNLSNKIYTNNNSLCNECMEKIGIIII